MTNKIGRVELAQAVTDNDGLADDGQDLTEILAAYGCDPNGAIHVATQRALRAIHASEGNLERFMAGENPRHVGSEELALVASAWLDGLCAALRVVAEEART